jgi:probable HAF family extracellular repeat protein
LYQINLIIQSKLGRSFAVCAFAFTLAYGTLAAVGLRESSRAEYPKREQTTLTFHSIDGDDDATLTFATGINNMGRIVGLYTDMLGGHGYIYDGPNDIKTLDFKNSTFTSTFTAAYSINDLGQVVGNYFDDNNISHSFRWVNGNFTEIVLPPSTQATQSIAKGIDNFGRIVGLFIRNNLIFRGFLLEGEQLTEVSPEGIPDVYDPNGGGSPPIGINKLGDIVGDFISKQDNRFHGYLRSNGNYTQIDFPESGVRGTSAFGINRYGHIVGTFIDQGGLTHGFLKIGNDYTRIDVPEEFGSDTWAFGINDLGQIVGRYLGKYDNKFHGFVASPTP